MMDVERVGIPVVLQRGENAVVLLFVVQIAVEVVLALRSARKVEVAEGSHRRRPLPRDVGEHPLVIRSAKKGEVVNLEPRAAPVLCGLPPPVTVVLGEAPIEPVTAQFLSPCIVLDAEETIRRLPPINAL